MNTAINPRAKARSPRLALFMAATLGLAATVAGAEQYDKHELYERLRFATQTPLQSAVIAGKTRNIHVEVRNPDPNPDKAVAVLVEELKKKTAAGQLPLSERQKSQMQVKYGTSDYTKLLSNPSVRSIVDQYIAREATKFRQSITAPKAIHETEADASWQIDLGQGARMESKYTKFDVSGESDAAALGRTDVQVVDPSATKYHAPRLTYGRVEHGMVKDPSRISSVLGHPNILAAGRPIVDQVWGEEQLVSAVSEETPEGKAIKTQFQAKKPDGTPSTTTILWVLPDKGYSVQKSETYQGGRLTETSNYTGYKEVEPGIWYPSKQAREQYQSDQLPPEVQLKVDQNELAIGSDELRKAQKLNLYLATYRDVASVKANATIPQSQFTLEFPNGTVVDDFVAGAGGQPLQFVVGGKRADDLKSDKVFARVDEANKEVATASGTAAAPKGAADTQASGTSKTSQGDVVVASGAVAQSKRTLFRFIYIAGAAVAAGAIGLIGWLRIHRRQDDAAAAVVRSKVGGRAS